MVLTIKSTMWICRVFKWCPVLLILAVLSWSYYAFVVELCFISIQNPVQKGVYLILYHVVFSLFIWSYWRTIFAELKPIPEKFKLPSAEIEKLLNAESEEEQRAIIENFAKDLPTFTKTMSGLPRYCNRCMLVKPDRAHHCSICNRCILKMDHHCPWVNNCVCYHNYKFFVLFLGYGMIYCLFIVVTCLPYFISFWKLRIQYRQKYYYCKQEAQDLDECMQSGDYLKITSEWSGLYHVIFVWFVGLMFFICLGPLLGYHVYLLVKNKSTIESFRAPNFRNGPDKNGFSLGCCKNIQEVFGEDPRLWPFPVFTSAGDGSVYPVRPEHQRATFTTQESHSYDSMGNTHASIGDGIVFPLPQPEEDTESLLSSERWDKWGDRPLPIDEYQENSSFDEL